MLKIINYKPIGFNKTNLPLSFYIDDEGLITNSIPSEFKVIDCKNSYLSPGWSDLHVHIWYGGSDVSIRANEAGFKRGVTTLVDTVTDELIAEDIGASAYSVVVEPGTGTIDIKVTGELNKTITWKAISVFNNNSL